MGEAGYIKGVFLDHIFFNEDNGFSIGTLLVLEHGEDLDLMQKALKRNGFEKCGIIYLDNGDPRIAYEKVR